MAAPVIKNRRARFEFEILERFEAGIVLLGTEVKSIREGNASLAESFARPRGSDLYLLNTHIAEYKQGGYTNHEPRRPRKLLLHRRELRRIISKINERGLTMVPLRLYFNRRGYAKVELGLCRGKKLYDKRAAMKKRDAQREIERRIARPGRGR